MYKCNKNRATITLNRHPLLPSLSDSSSSSRFIYYTIRRVAKRDTPPNRIAFLLLRESCAVLNYDWIGQLGRDTAATSVRVSRSRSTERTVHSYSVDARVLRITAVGVNLHFDYLVRLFRLILQLNFFHRKHVNAPSFLSTGGLSTTKRVEFEETRPVVSPNFVSLFLPESQSTVTEDRHCRTRIRQTRKASYPRDPSDPESSNNCRRMPVSPSPRFRFSNWLPILNLIPIFLFSTLSLPSSSRLSFRAISKMYGYIK